MPPLPILDRTAEWVRARPRATTALALAVVPALLLRDALMGGGALYQRDVHLYWHAEAEAFVRAVAAGAWPLWDRTVGFGQPLLANSSAQVAYPPTWINLLMPPWWYYTLFVFAHLALSGAGAYQACRALGGSRWAGLASGALWMACGPFVSLTGLWHHFAGAAWLPWVLAAALAFAAAPGARSALALAVALGVQVLAGSFDMVAMGAATAAAVVLFALAWAGPGGAPRRRTMAWASAAAVLAVGLSAVQWMPTLELAARTGRRALPREMRTYWSVHPAALPELALPGFGHSVPVSPSVKREMFEGREPFLASLYLGLASAGLVLAGLVDRRRRRHAAALAAAATLAVLFALGRHFVLYDAMSAVLPPLAMFRYPVKVTVLVALPWCLLAGLGVDFVRAAAPGSRAARAVRIGALAAPLGAAIVAAVLAAAGAMAGARTILVAVAMASLAAALVVKALEGGASRPALAAAAGLVAAADLVLYHRSMNAVAPIELYTHRPEVMGHLDGRPDARLYAYDYSVTPPGGPPVTGGEAGAGRRLARMPAGWSLGPAAALAQQLSLTPLVSSRWGLSGSFEVDYTGLFPTHVNQAAYLLRAMEGTPAHRLLLQRGGVTNVVALHEGPFADLRLDASLPGLYESPIRVYGVPGASPRAFVVPRTRTGEGESGLNALVDGGFDYTHEALVPASAPPGGGTRPGRARIVSARPDRLTVEAEAPDGGYVVVLESYDPGWQATVDGARAPVVPANVLFRGVALAPGAHVIEMVYRPAGVVAGAAVSAVSALAAAILAWRTRGRPRREVAA